jgi:broad specificity phosphatase PhoE
MRATFVRHGQSMANAGLPSRDLASIALTELGHAQARAVAAAWIETPALIVTSPLLRTQQTAAPTIARFSGAPIEVWPIEEFTYLQPARWNGTLSAERMPYLVRYWSAADPDYCDGDGAESFATMLRRVEAALARLAALPEGALVYIFGHGQFIQAARSIVVDCELDDRARMRGFWRAGAPPVIGNAELVRFAWFGRRWKYRGSHIIVPPSASNERATAAASPPCPPSSPTTASVPTVRAGPALASTRSARPSRARCGAPAARSSPTTPRSKAASTPIGPSCARRWPRPSVTRRR